MIEFLGKGGVYCEDNHLSEKWKGEGRDVWAPGYAEYITSDEQAEKLWKVSEELTKFKFPTL